MDGVVAVVHIGPAELAEGNLERDISIAVTHVPDILSLVELHCGDRLVPTQGLRFFEVEVERVTPAASARNGPVLDIPGPRQIRDPPHVSQVRGLAIHLDPPGLVPIRVVEGEPSAVSTPDELDDPRSDRCDSGDLPRGP